MTAPDGDGGGSANAALFTQAQVNHFTAESKRGALEGFFKGELGLDKVPTPEEFKGLLTAASEHQKLKAGEKGDVERLTSELSAMTEKANKVPTLEAQLLRARLAGDAGLKSRYWKYVEGDDEEAVKASVTETLTDIRGGGDGDTGDGGEGDGGDAGAGDQGSADQQQQQNGRTGTGGLAPNPQQGAGSGGKPPKTTLQAGRELYEAKHGKKE